MANQKHDILIYQKLNDLPAQLQEFLHARGFASRMVTQARDLYNLLSELKDPILLFEGGNNSYATQKCMEELLALPFLPNLKEFPLILVGTGASQHESTLMQHFKVFVSLEAPCSNSDILDALQYAVHNYASLLAKLDVHSSTSGPSTIFQVDEETQKRKREASYEASMRVPRHFFQQMITGGLKRADLSGSQYFTGRIDENFLRENGLLNIDQKTISAVNQTLEVADKWSKKHIFRTTFMANQLAGAINISSDISSYLASASLLFSDAILRSAPDLMRLNYTRPGRTLARKELCSRIKDSAMKAAAELGSPELGSLIARVGRIIGAEESWQDSDESLLASTIVIADATDRIFYKSGTWDPRAANSIMRRIKEGTFLDVHPSITACLIKFISEASLSKPWTFLLPKQIRLDPALVEQSRRMRELVPDKNEQKIMLGDLEPGMKLSKPLLAFDGRKILTEDLTLDEDLIWRIWQLAALRPLNSAMVVSNEH